MSLTGIYTITCHTWTNVIQHNTWRLRLDELLVRFSDDCEDIDCDDIDCEDIDCEDIDCEDIDMMTLML